MKRVWIIPVVAAVVVIIGLAIWRTVKFDNLFAREYPALDGGVYSTPVTKNGEKYLVPPNEVYDSGLGTDGVLPINSPKYTDVYTADQQLADEIFGIDVEAGGVHYFYPYQIMNWHEVVNDTLNGVPLAITYSTLCGTPIVYERTINDTAVDFAVSGKIYNDASLLTDGTSSTLWNQATGQAIVGQTVGQQLTRYPALTMPWSVWKDTYPNGQVLSMDTGYARKYDHHPYGAYETSPTMFFPVNHLNEHLKPKVKVYDVTNGLTHVAYAAEYLPAQTEPNLTVGEGETALQTVAMMDYETEVVKVFNRTVDGRVLTFVRAGNQFTDKETGSAWNLDGLSIHGELRGTQLAPVIAPAAYAFCYSAMYPTAAISGDEIFDWDGDGTVEGAGEGATSHPASQGAADATITNE